MQAPRQTVPVQALRVARFVEAIAHERAIPSNAIAKTLRGTCAALCCDVLGVVARSPERTWSCSKLKKELPMRTILALATAVIAAFTAVAHAQQIEWEKVDAAFGRKAATTVGDVHRYGFPRSDLNVTVDGVAIKPALALGGWVAFKPAHGGAMVMGDLVLLETEINPVMTKLREGGLDITASTIICCGLIRKPFTCTSVATGI